jgi:endogenous inhibitor of DNA gyrase (YacG/DUF329 family)
MRDVTCRICGKKTKTTCKWKEYCSQKCRMDGWIIERAKKIKVKNPVAFAE